MPPIDSTFFQPTHLLGRELLKSQLTLANARLRRAARCAATLGCHAGTQPPEREQTIQLAFGPATHCHLRMTRESATIVRAEPKDAEALAPLFDSYRRFYGQPSNLERARAFLTDRLRRGESSVFIACVGDRFAGFVQLFPSFSSVSLAPTFVLNDLYVASDYRRCGIGRALIAAAVACATEAGAVRISLSTAVTNSAAQALYEAVGWSKQTDYDVYVLKT